MLLVLLSVSLFQSLLALEKIFIGLVLLFICLIALWFFSFPALQYSQFGSWLFGANKGTIHYIAPLINSGIPSLNRNASAHLQNIENQFDAYCR